MTNIKEGAIFVLSNHTKKYKVMENFKVVIWGVEETIAPAYYGCEREEYVDAFNCEASVYDPRTDETICSQSFENLTLEEFEALKRGEIEIIPTKVGTVILI